MALTLTETARNAMNFLAGVDAGLREPNRDLGKEANEARRTEPSVSAIEHQRALTAKQQQDERLHREASQTARQGEDRQSPEQEAAGRNQSSVQQKQNRNESLIARIWKTLLHHVPKMVMGVARSMGVPMDYATAKGAAKNGVDSPKEIASAVKQTQSVKNIKPDNTPAMGGGKEIIR